MTNVADNIKAIISAKGFKQKIVAERANIPEKKFCDMLNGRATIKACHVPAIAVALEVTPNELLGFADTKRINETA